MKSCTFCALGALLVVAAAAVAQESVPFGAIRVPPCQPSPDPEYGTVEAKAVAIGGGPMYMASRQRNYLNALRGPQGQVAAGAPLDPAKPPKEFESLGFAVLAYPVPCGDRSIAPTNVELSTTQGRIARNPAGEPLRGEALAKAFPGLPTPEGSIGLWFRNTQPAQARITYAEGCNGGPADTSMAFRAEPPRLLELVPGVLPAGSVESEPVVYVQVIIDPDGHLAGPQYLGGPRSLYPAALEALAKWRAQPTRVNGAGVVTPNVVQVPFRP